MIGWIRDLFGAVGRTINDAFDYARQIVEGVWNALTSLGHFMVSGWSAFLNGIKAIGAMIKRGAISLYTLGKYIITVFVPHWIMWAVGKAFALAKAEIVTAWNLLRGIVDNLGHYLLSLIHTVEDWAHRAVALIERGLNDIIDFAHRIGKIVNQYLLHPEVLAALLVPLLITPVMRYLRDHGAAFATWLLKHLVAVMLSSADFLEGVLTDAFL